MSRLQAAYFAALFIGIPIAVILGITAIFLARGGIAENG